MALWGQLEPLEAVRRHAVPLTGAAGDYDPLLKRIGDARFVLIGEASHGTHEFYQQRAEVTQRLIQEKGFHAVAVEADWPDAYRVNCYVAGQDGDGDAEEALRGFRRFPTWMWRNTAVVDFIGWLRDHNDDQPAGAEKVGFYGLDLYSLRASMQAVLGYLDRVDPEAARRARDRYACFEDFGEDVQSYGYAASLGLSPSCEEAVLQELIDLRSKAASYSRLDGRLAEDRYFFAEQNARLVQNAERYYRSMFRGRISSWNLRDTHMAETLEALVAHLAKRLRSPKVVVWAHNSHLGDARATEMGWQGELNIGQLVRERYGDDSVLVGFSTYAGTVTAADNWDEPAARTRVRPGMPHSYEELFHRAGTPNFTLDLREPELRRAFGEPLLQRAIGVIYRPETERQSHYFHARLAEQFDALLHFDHTRAVEPLERSAQWQPGEPAETYPVGV